MIYIYQVVAETINGPVLELIYTFDSKGAVGYFFGFDRTWLKGVMKRNG
jgi:hypothetical protein